MGQNHARDIFDNVMVVVVVLSHQEVSLHAFYLVVDVQPLIPQTDSSRRTLFRVRWGLWLGGRPILLADQQAWSSGGFKKNPVPKQSQKQEHSAQQAAHGRHLGVLGQWEFLTSLPAFTALQMFATARHSAFVILQIHRSF